MSYPSSFMSLVTDDRGRARRAIDPVAKVVRVGTLTNDHLYDPLGRFGLLVFAVLCARFVLLTPARGHVAVACGAMVGVSR